MTSLSDTLFENIPGIGSDGHVDNERLTRIHSGDSDADSEAQVNVRAHLRWCDYCADRASYLVQHKTKLGTYAPAGAN